MNSISVSSFLLKFTFGKPFPLVGVMDIMDAIGNLKELTPLRLFLLSTPGRKEVSKIIPKYVRSLFRQQYTVSEGNPEIPNSNRSLSMMLIGHARSL